MDSKKLTDDEQVLEALTLWLMDTSKTPRPLRQTFEKHWYRVPPTLLIYIAKQAANANRIVPQIIRQTLDAVCRRIDNVDSAQDQLKAVLGTRILDKAEEALRQERLRQRCQIARGLCHAVRAVVGGPPKSGPTGNEVPAGPGFWNWKPRKSDPQDFEAEFNDLQTVFESYDAAWGLESEEVLVQQRQLLNVVPSDMATDILDHFTARFPDTQRPRWLNKANWLIARRLLSYLLAPKTDAETVGKPNRIHLLATLPIDKDGKQPGTTLAVVTSALKEGHTALYLDPVLSGLLALDENMRSSLRIAGWLSANELKNRQENKSLDVSLRLSLDQTKPPPGALNGNSGGGLLIAASVATARGTELDSDATATFAVVPATSRARSWLNVSQSPEAASQQSPTSLTVDDFKIGSVGEVVAKLTNNNSLRELKILRVFLYAGQTDSEGKIQWDDLERLVAETGLKLIPVGKKSFDGQTTTATLAQFIDAMTGNAQIERVLEEYSKSVAYRWATQRADDSDRDGLKHYVPPSFAKKVRDGKVMDESERESLRRQGVEVEQPYEPISPPDADEETRFRDLFALGPRIVVTEDAGAGKSIFTRRAAAWCSEPIGQAALFETRAGLACRWERVDADWPVTCDGYRAALEKAVSPWCSGDITPQKVVEYALRNGRVVLLCDALDQQMTGEASSEKLSALKQFLAYLRTDYPQTRVIVTGRAFSYEKQQSMFPTREWLLCQLSGFSPMTQLRYLADLIEQHELIDANDIDRWRDWRSQGVCHQRHRDDRSLDPDKFAIELLSSPRLFGNLYPSVRELLQVPAILAFVRTLCRQGQGFPRFSNRADLYFQANTFLLDRNLEMHTELAVQIREHKFELMEILAAVAFQMMVNNSQNYVVQGESAVNQLQKSVRNLISTESILNQWAKLWSLVEQLAGFTSHLVVERKSHDYFGWKHRGMMEFYCGLFLSKNTSPSWPDGLQRQRQKIRLTELLSDPQWTWAVRFSYQITEALDLEANAWSEPDVLQVTFRAMFEMPQKHPRPTEHMFHAWQLMKQDPVRYPGLPEILSSYRQQFLDILAGTAAVPDRSMLPSEDAGDPLQRAQWAAELLTERDVWQYVGARRDERGWQYSFRQLRPSYVTQLGKILRPDGPEGPEGDATDEELAEWFQSPERCEGGPDARPAHTAYALCSNATSQFSKFTNDRSRLTFLMGASPGWVPLSIDSFQMATCCVTRAQYRLFDPHRERNDLDDINKRSPDDDCPMIYVNWWDGFCFALWLGDEYRLPNEVQWEGAAWGGLDRKNTEKNHVISVEPYEMGYTPDHVNYNGKEKWDDKNPRTSAGRTLPVRWDGDRRKQGLSEPKSYVPAAYQPNGFGLWQVNGNVWEWSLTNWCDELKDAIEASKGDFLDSTVNTGAGRVVRGGSWSSIAGGTRSSFRNWYEAGYRYNGAGFRLTRTF